MNNVGFGGGIILLGLLFDVEVLGGILELKAHAHIPQCTATFTTKAFYGIYSAANLSYPIQYSGDRQVIR